MFYILVLFNLIYINNNTKHRKALTTISTEQKKESINNYINWTEKRKPIERETLTKTCLTTVILYTTSSNAHIVFLTNIISLHTAMVQFFLYIKSMWFMKHLVRLLSDSLEPGAVIYSRYVHFTFVRY